MPIPLVDLHAQYREIGTDVNAAIERVIRKGAFIGGEEVRSFQAEFAAYCAAPAVDGQPAPELHCAACGNGTDALYLSLRALGVGRGDEVITVAHTFIATAEAITLTGARPVFVDVLEDTMLMDPDAVEAAISPRTAALLPVHLYGQPCDMDRLLEIARRHCIPVVEDSAQAHGARWRGQRVGSSGDAACFSFYPGKNLGAYGDAGAMVTRDESLAQRIRMLANHGRKEKYTHEMEGVNSRLDALQAAILRVKLQHLDRWNEARRRHAARYLELLRDTDIVLPTIRPEAEPVWHLFVVRVREREKLQAQLAQLGISTGVHYPVPLHLQPAYEYLGLERGSLPVTERVADEVMSLPLYPEMTEAQVEEVAEALRSLVQARQFPFRWSPAEHEPAQLSSVPSS